MSRLKTWSMHAVRGVISGFLLVKVAQETGPWTAGYLAWMWLGAEIVSALLAYNIKRLSSAHALLTRVEAVVATAERTTIAAERRIRTSGPYVVSMSCALLVMSISSTSFAFTDTAYCYAIAKAERQKCRAEQLSTLADCASDYAWARWIDDPTALETVDACRTEATDALRGCVGEVGACE